MPDPANDRDGISSDTEVHPVQDFLIEPEDITSEFPSNTDLQENDDNDNHCHENIENPVPVANTEIVEYAKRADGKDSKKVLFDEVYKALSENLECEPEEKDQLLFNLKLDIGKRIYKGKPPMPKEEYLGKWESGNPVKWFIDKYQDVLLFAEPKYKQVVFKKENPKLYRSMKEVFLKHHDEITSLFDEKLFQQIGITTQPRSMSELFGKAPRKRASYAKDYLDKSKTSSNTHK